MLNLRKTSRGDIFVFHPNVPTSDTDLVFEAEAAWPRTLYMTAATTGAIALLWLMCVIVPSSLLWAPIGVFLAAMCMIVWIVRKRVAAPLLTVARLVKNGQAVVFLFGSESAAFYEEQFRRFAYIPDEDAWTVRADVFPKLLQLARADLAVGVLEDTGYGDGDAEYDQACADYRNACTAVREVVDLYVRNEPA